MKKRAQGMPVNILIIVAIGLIVLIVLAVLIGRNVLDFGRTTSGCEQKGGICVKTVEDCSNKDGRVISDSCPSDKKYCCLTPEAYAS